MRVTVAVCTYNRSERLRLMLTTLTKLQNPSSITWELLVIDNNSTDATRAVVKDFETVLPLRYILEPRQGVSHARNRVVREAQGELLFFTDDDVRVDEHWLWRMEEAVRENPDVGFFGGRIIPLWERSQPAWFDPEKVPTLGAIFACHDGGDAPAAYNELFVPNGANMSFRRKVIGESGGFRTDLDCVGGSGLLGGDTELCVRLLRSGVSGVYVPKAVVFHPAFAERCRKSYVWKWHLRYGRSMARMNPPPRGRRRPLWLAKRACRVVQHGTGVVLATVSGQERQQVFHLSELGYNLGLGMESRRSIRRH